MINLDAYSFSTIQEARGIAQLALADGLDLSGLIEVLALAIPPTPHTAVRSNTQPPARCPACGRHNLVPAFNDEHLIILACRGCRYSMIFSPDEGSPKMPLDSGRSIEGGNRG